MLEPNQESEVIIMYFCVSLGGMDFELIILNIKKCKVYKNLIYELNKRIDDIKNHSMNNSFWSSSCIFVLA
jgi:hypothetical protein